MHDNHAALLTIVVCFLRTFFGRIFHTCHITQIDRHPVVGAYHDVKYLVASGKLLLYAHRIDVGAEVDRTCRHVEVFGGKNLANFLHGDAIGIEFVGVAQHLHLALRNAGD